MIERRHIYLAMSCLTTTGAVFVVYNIYSLYIDCEQNDKKSKHWISIGPTCDGDNITGPPFTSKRLCSFIDDFPLNGYPASIV